MDKILITLTKNESRLIISVEGELDASTCITAEKLFEEALAIEASAIFVDCSRLTYISSAGLGVLISMHHSCTQKNIPVHFCDVQPKVKNVLEILGLDRLFDIDSSLDEALGKETSPNL